jgi:hypothetical protein
VLVDIVFEAVFKEFVTEDLVPWESVSFFVP